MLFIMESKIKELKKSLKFTKGRIGIGEEISSYSRGLGYALSNSNFTSPMGYAWSKTHYCEGTYNYRKLLSSGIEFNGVHYLDVEQAYQSLKHDYKIGIETEILMIKLIMTKFRTFPSLIRRIDDKGGLDYLLDCTHLKGRKTFYGSDGQNLFLILLTISYLLIKDESNSSK